MSIVENEEDIEAYKHHPTILTAPREDDCDMVIIGEAQYEEDFNEFMEWKRKKGIIVKYKTTESIWDEYPSGDDWHSHPITDMAGRIRAYLNDMYSNHCLVYAIIVGGESDYDITPDSNDVTLPVRYCCVTLDTWIMPVHPFNPDDPNYENNNYYRIPADLYFSDFDGDYDIEGDSLGYYGELDEWVAYAIDVFPEIFVGRVVVSPQEEVDNHEQIRRWTEKLITYETNPGYGDFDYLMKSVLFNGYISYTGEDRWYQGTFTDLLNQHLNEFTIWNAQHNPPGPTGVEIIDKINEGYGITHFYYHGCKTRLSNEAIQFGYLLYALDKYFHEIGFEGDGLDCLVEGNGKFSVIYSFACNPGSYDKTYIEYSGGEQGEKICFAEAFTTYTKDKGGPAIIACTNHGGGEDVEKHFLEDIFENNCYNIGVALANAKCVTDDHVLMLGLTLFGDPEMPVWTEIPSYLEISHDYEENSVQ